MNIIKLPLFFVTEKNSPSFAYCVLGASNQGANHSGNTGGVRGQVLEHAHDVMLCALNHCLSLYAR